MHSKIRLLSSTYCAIILFKISSSFDISVVLFKNIAFQFQNMMGLFESIFYVVDMYWVQNMVFQYFFTRYYLSFENMIIWFASILFIRSDDCSTTNHSVLVVSLNNMIVFVHKYCSFVFNHNLFSKSAQCVTHISKQLWMDLRRILDDSLMDFDGF